MSELSRLGIWLIGAGLVLAVAGLVLAGVGRIPGLGRLPGDFYYEGEHLRVYVPLTTCLLLSILLSLILYLVSR